jgi:hypothetical protein
MMNVVWLLAQSPPSPDPLIDWLTRAGMVGVLAVAIVGFIRGWIVSGSEHKRVMDERDRAVELVYRQADLAARAVDAQVGRLELERELVQLREEASRRREPRKTR